MIRVALISASFFAITLALILLQPTSGLRAPDPDNLGDVTRADTTLTAPLPAQSAASATEPSAAQIDMAVRLADPALTNPALTNPAAAPAPFPAPFPAPLPAPATQNQITQAQITPRSLDPAIEAGLENIIISALGQGQSQSYIDALVNQAARSGDITVPDQLITPDGRVNTTALLSTLTKKALTEGPGAGLYVVRPGDTLASIAYRFYGQTRFSTEIFNANRDQLGTSTQLKVGQKLVMPTL